MRLIDAERLIEKLLNDSTGDMPAWVILVGRAFAKLIDEQPTVEECDIHCPVHDELIKQLKHAQKRNKEYIETIQDLKMEIKVIEDMARADRTRHVKQMMELRAKVVE